MKDLLVRVWRVLRWLLLALFVLYLVLVGYRVYVLGEEDKTVVAVERIHSSKLTMSDVGGENLPPAPDPKENNATLAGVDANKNGIRDDVELAIFEKYKGRSFMKERAAALQYAKALQMEFTEVFNSETLVAVLQQQSRGFGCVYGHEEEVQKLVFNTQARIDHKEQLLRKYLTTYALPNGEDCDIVF